MDEEIRVCSMCGCELQENETIEVEGDLICDECATEHTTTCDHCGETIWTEDAITDEHMTLCSCCYDDHYRRCENCGRLVHDNDTLWSKTKVFLRDWNAPYRVALRTQTGVCQTEG